MIIDTYQREIILSEDMHLIELALWLPNLVTASIWTLIKVVDPVAKPKELEVQMIHNWKCMIMSQPTNLNEMNINNDIHWLYI